eukprot:3811347-Prymnesium_polylepis.1
MRPRRRSPSYARVRRGRAAAGCLSRSEGIFELPHAEIANELYDRRRTRRHAVCRRRDAMKGGTTRRR